MNTVSTLWRSLRFISAIWNSYSKSDTARRPRTMQSACSRSTRSMTSPSNEVMRRRFIPAVHSSISSSRSLTPNSGSFAGFAPTAMISSSKMRRLRSMRSRWPLWMGSNMPGYTARLPTRIPRWMDVGGSKLGQSTQAPERKSRSSRRTSAPSRGGEARAAASTLLRRARGVGGHHASARAEAESLDVVAQRAERGGVLFHEHCRRRAAGERLDAHAPAAREEVEKRTVGQERHQCVEARDPHAVRRGPRGGPPRSVEPLPLQLAREHSHPGGRPPSADARQIQLAPPAREQRRAELAVFRRQQARIALHHRHRLGASVLEHGAVAQEIRDAKRRQAGLPRSEEISGAAHREVDLRDAKAVVGLRHRGDAPARVLGSRVRHENAVALPRAAAHAPAELV